MSNNEERLKKAFAAVLSIPIETIGDTLAFKECQTWDSIAHMALVAAIDTEFGTMMETEDIIDMSSFKKAKEILAKYGIAFDS